jgi:ABC-2 type transport system permease protein
VNGTYLRFELRRTLRNRRFLFLSLGFPLVLYFLIAGPNRNKANLGGTGLSAPLYFMVGLAAFGTMNAMLSAGARIAGERAAGWNRQLRITPLTTRTYFRAKVVTGYAMAAMTLVVLYAAGLSPGVSLTAHEWVRMTWLILVGLLPFAALGIVIGHLVTPDTVGPVMGGATALLALLGGTWFPITGGVMQKIGEALPSYWLVQAGHVGPGGAARAGRGRAGSWSRSGRPRGGRRPLRVPAGHPARLTQEISGNGGSCGARAAMRSRPECEGARRRASAPRPGWQPRPVAGRCHTTS